MYGTLYTSSEYYDYDEHIVSLDADGDKLCIVCWLPSKYKEPVINMKKVDNYFSSCHCNALIHGNCLKTWMMCNHSCPICRKMGCSMLVNCDDKYIKLTKYLLICLRCTYYFFKFASFFTTIYVFYTCFFLDISLLYDHNQDAKYEH